MGDAQEAQALSNVRRWQSTADGCLIQTAPEDTSIVRASPPERQKWHPRTPTRPVAPLLDHPLNRKAFRHHNISLRDARLRQVQDLFLLPGPLFFSYYFIVCNLSKHIQLAPDFVEHDRVYHPRCTFGAPSTADIEESLNNPGRFGGCLLFEDREVADALSKRHLNVKQIVVSACPVPPLLSDPTLRCQNYKLGGLLESLVRLVFRDCDELTELPSNLSRCQALRTLVVHRCSYLRRLKPLADESLTKESKLHHLFLIACPRLQDTLHLANLPTLRLCVARQCGLLTVVVNHENNAPTELLQLVISQVFRMQAEPSADQVTHCDRSYSGEEPEGENIDKYPAAVSKDITLPPSLQNFGFEWTNSECPAIESFTVPSQDMQNQEQPSSHLRGVSFCRHTLLECLPRHICTKRLEKLAMIGCTSLDQKKFVRDDLHTLTSLRQLRVSLAFDQVLLPLVPYTTSNLRVSHL